MSKQAIGLGTTANDGTGDDLRSGGDKINDNFDEIYTALGDGTDLDPNLEPYTTAEQSKLAALLTAATLASTANGNGASLIGFEDAAGLTDETNLEAVIGAILNTLDNNGTIVTADLGDYVAIDGQDVIVFDAGGSSSAARPSHSSTKTVIWVNHGSSTPSNMGQYDIALGGGVGVSSVNTQTGTSYTLVIGDSGVNIDMNNASANTVTIPTNATVAFSVGTVIPVTQLGAGTTTVEGATGVSVNGTSAGSVDINNQYSGCVLRKIATDSWVIQGDIT